MIADEALSDYRWVMSARDWKAYNEALVRRGEILLDLRIVKGWKRELAEMNEGKEGAQYEYPQSLIRLLAFIHFYLRYMVKEMMIKASLYNLFTAMTPGI